MGISYGGISQLFVGATRPPNLAAITPLSVIDNTADDALPGRHPQHRLRRSQWAQDRVARREAGVGHRAARPGPTSGSRRATRPARPTRTLHPEAVDLIGKIHAQPLLPARGRRPARPVTFVNKINVPVFMACQWTDEQTGGHCPTSPSTSPAPTEVVHLHQRRPHRLARPGDLQPLVRLPRALRRRGRRPQLTRRGDRPLAPVIYQAAMGVPGVTLPPDPIQDQPTYARRWPRSRALPPVRVLFDNGAGGARRARPYPGFERSFSASRPGHQGPLLVPRRRTARSPTSRPSARAAATASPGTGGARPPTDFTGDTAPAAAASGRRRPSYDWTPAPAGHAPSPTSARPLSARHHGHRRRRRARLGPRLGPGRRPPGDDHRGPARRQGDLRAERLAAERASASSTRRKSTPLEPVLSLRRRDAAPLPKGQLRQGHHPALLPGPRVPGRLAHPRHDRARPDGDQPVWAFGETVPSGNAKVTRRLLAQAPVAPRPPGGPGSHGADRRCRRARACAASPAATTGRRRGVQSSAQRLGRVQVSGARPYGELGRRDLVPRPSGLVGDRVSPLTVPPAPFHERASRG